MTSLLALLVFACSASMHYSGARSTRALVAGRRHAYAAWGVLEWAGAVVGFVVCITVSLWLLPAEAAGLYLGKYLGSAGDREVE